MTKRTQKAYDKWAPAYDTDPNPHILLEHDDVLKLMAPKRHEKILDAGCGTGKYSVEFHKKDADIIGIDFSKQMLEVARNKYPAIKFYQADLEKKLSFKNEQFDKINCAQTLKHLRNIQPTLNEFFRVLHKGGTLIFSVTHPEMNWDGFEMKDRPDFVLSENSDIFHHQFKDYFEAINKIGFKIDKIVQVPISTKIRHLLTAKSYKIVKGRYEVIIFRLMK
ncbi:MAG: hypothetical protein US42_C0014G0043 [Candidatus Magasanikbacteria bacterium GW2011_GWC2_37_14]|uniref:Methyltransferase domain-containing protein n=1 Tax=Candidatus Magasanikbacteria bacterium GW2011_GWC2_37_14 TaxID=1619046 RepID=A0A0G0JGB2_9BACT|nr:MAG: hypothetical protein US42_C0014G0043 [Candidatus Magasanikbacteria bacterium GW2011_GWC2_37_14]